LSVAELADTGEWSLQDLARWAIEQGFTIYDLKAVVPGDDRAKAQDMGAVPRNSSSAGSPASTAPLASQW
jgi:hypothetical protein